MYEKEKVLNSFRKQVCDLFEVEKDFFIVKREISEKKNCDHVFFTDGIHESIKTKTEDTPDEIPHVIVIQRQKDEVRLRFPRRQLDNYKVLNKALESEKEKNSEDFRRYYNSKVTKDAMCFDFYYGDIKNSIKRDEALTFIDRLIKVTKHCNFTTNKLFSGKTELKVSNNSTYFEGSVQEVLVNKYERNPKARQDCLKHYGFNCTVCDFNFEKAYGELAKGVIHVHHIKPLHEIASKYEVDPIKDLRPVCPNCHAVIHSRRPQYEIEELREILKQQGVFFAKGYF